MGLVKSAIGDAILTSVWVFSVPTLRILTSEVASFLNLHPSSLAGLFITTVISTILVFTISLIGRILGGASFNPSTTVSFYAAGLRPDSSLTSMAVRFPAQAAGGVAGAHAILHLIPTQYKSMLKGPYLKVDLHTGAMAEGALTFALNLAILIFLKGPKNPLLKVYLVSVTTVSLVIPGSAYTGPSMNPANAFGWAYINNRHNTWEQFYVYWICPFIGATLAASVYRFLFTSPAKRKKA
ncbi:aquaporin SIP1-1-like [Neltuma alba]|uniref:aquaporin SIP1-1-like n=1 Tax=Neltuma alba TaxID=207710 RepID=UPI0010A54044|nr:aquaporin SIP1-1-like [Prosopis alba]